MNTSVATRPDSGFMPTAAPARSAMVAMETTRAVAETQAAIYLAKQFPRNEKIAVDRILAACERPSLAEKAVYSYARGGSDIAGPSIHLAKAIAREWGNVNFGIRELSNAGGESEVEAFAWDIETNAREVKVFQVKHWRDTKSGGYALKDQRDVYELVANQGARRMRACILGIIPGDVVDLAIERCEATLKASVEVTPALIAEMVKKFAEFSVSKAMIEKKIQRNIETLTPGQVVNLRKIFNSLRDGVAAVGDFFEVEAPVEPAAKGNEGVRAAMQKTGASDSKPDAAQGDAASASKPAGRRAAAAPAVTYASVSDAMRKAHAAKNKDDLDAAAAMIAGVADETVHGELNALYKTYLAELAQGAE